MLDATLKFQLVIDIIQHIIGSDDSLYIPVDRLRLQKILRDYMTPVPADKDSQEIYDVLSELFLPQTDSKTSKGFSIRTSRENGKSKKPFNIIVNQRKTL